MRSLEDGHEHRPTDDALRVEAVELLGRHRARLPALAASPPFVRGEITKDAGGYLENETTAHNDAHDVERYTAKDGRVVARDRETVIVQR